MQKIRSYNVTDFDFTGLSQVDIDKLLSMSPEKVFDFRALKGITDEILESLPGAKFPAVVRAVNVAVVRVLTDLVKTDVQTEMFCFRDYRLLCPRDWADMGDGDTCEASDGYSAPAGASDCNVVLHSGIFSVSDKISFSKRCNVQWPCTDACVEDYSKPCPDKWTIDSPSSICFASPEYRGPCLRQYDFEFHNTRMKKEWSIICRAPWPCTQTGKVLVSINSKFKPLEDELN